jgi:hypothetical protein
MYLCLDVRVTYTILQCASTSAITRGHVDPTLLNSALLCISHQASTGQNAEGIEECRSSSPRQHSLFTEHNWLGRWGALLWLLCLPAHVGCGRVADINRCQHVVCLRRMWTMRVVIIHVQPLMVILGTAQARLLAHLRKAPTGMRNWFAQA